jgi:Zn finger protein HypA/HybF involved in hydrogenase expression
MCRFYSQILIKMETEIWEILIQLSANEISLKDAHDQIINTTNTKYCMSCEKEVKYSSGVFTCDECSY